MARDTRRGGGLAWDGIGPDGSVIESFPGAALLIDGSLDEMKAEPSRRDFLTVSARSLLVTTGVILSTTQPSASVETTPGAPLPIQEGVLIDMLPKNLSYAERFRMAREAGFEVVQAQTTSDSMVAEEINLDFSPVWIVRRKGRVSTLPQKQPPIDLPRSPWTGCCCNLSKGCEEHKTGNRRSRRG